jgi:N-acetylglucosaminyldiphosphoundecaprenol N-acetyl-beta-D-mannosaminyltransferase
MPHKTADSVVLLGVRVQSISVNDLVRQVECYVASGNHHQIMYTNAHVLNTAYGDPDLRRILNAADLVYCDGAGVKLGARLSGQYLPERMTGADWIFSLGEVCQKTGFKLFFLGGEPGVAETAARKLQVHYPGLSVVGTHHGYFHHDGSQNDAVIATINTARPDILLVGFGTPLQEKWIDRNFGQLEAPVVWAVGALVDFVAGKKPRAPQWMLESGLEWLYRLLSEPGRLWKRYVIGNPIFIWRVLRQRIGTLRFE